MNNVTSRKRVAFMDLKEVVIYTDGACIGNPGPGGYGVVLLFGGHRKELSEGFRRTTNNRMEIMAAIAGLKALKFRCRVTIYTDSQYLARAIELGWAQKWKARGWKRNKKEKALNPDLWEELLRLCDEHEVTFQWVRGHNGNRENERCDHLATRAAKGKKLNVDSDYENPKANRSGPSSLF